MKYANTIIIGSLLIILLVMSVGYAAFATQLQLNGTATIQGDWDVEITKIEATNIVGTAEAGTPTNTKTTATVTATYDSSVSEVPQITSKTITGLFNYAQA